MTEYAAIPSGATVADLCAAPGGKAIELSQGCGKRDRQRQIVRTTAAAARQSAAAGDDEPLSIRRRRPAPCDHSGGRGVDRRPLHRYGDVPAASRCAVAAQDLGLRRHVGAAENDHQSGGQCRKAGRSSHLQHLLPRARRERRAGRSVPVRESQLGSGAAARRIRRAGAARWRTPSCSAAASRNGWGVCRATAQGELSELARRSPACVPVPDCAGRRIPDLLRRGLSLCVPGRSASRRWNSSERRRQDLRGCGGDSAEGGIPRAAGRDAIPPDDPGQRRDPGRSAGGEQTEARHSRGAGGQRRPAVRRSSGDDQHVPATGAHLHREHRADAGQRHRAARRSAARSRHRIVTAGRDKDRASRQRRHRAEQRTRQRTGARSLRAQRWRGADR